MGSLIAAVLLFLSWQTLNVTALPATAGGCSTRDADYAIVLSGDPGGRRTSHAVELFKAGYVKRVLITGGGAGGDSAEVLGRQALQEGLPADQLDLETSATSTWQNMQLSRPLLIATGARRVTIVTSRVHARRAFFVARRVLAGLDVAVCPVETGDTDLKNRLIEVVKAWGYLLRGQLSVSEVLPTG